MKLLVKFILLAFTLAVVVAEDDFQSLRKEMYEMNLRNTRKIDRLEQEFRHVKSELSAFEAVNTSAMVGFFARPVGNLDVSEGQNVVYTEVLTNYGEAYSANSGFFTAPVNGVYLFSAFMQTVGGADTAIVLMRGNVQQCFLETIPTDWGAASCTVVLDLDAGEEIFLRGYSNGDIHGEVDGASGFTGHLILEAA